MITAFHFFFIGGGGGGDILAALMNETCLGKYMKHLNTMQMRHIEYLKGRTRVQKIYGAPETKIPSMVTPRGILWRNLQHSMNP